MHPALRVGSHHDRVLLVLSRCPSYQGRARPAAPKQSALRVKLSVLGDDSHSASLALNAPPVLFFDSGTHIEDKPPMPKKPGTNPKGEFAFFNVVYEDGSQRSNRRVPAELLGGLDGDKPARGYILEQDREIAEKSGRSPLAIKSIRRVGEKKK